MEQGTKTTPVAETWRPVRGYEGLYEVSDLARVRSLDRYIDKVRRDGIPYRRTVKGKIIKLYKDAKEYWIAPLIKDRIRHSVLVHRIVAIAFVPNPNNLPIINHKDENKSNNAICNLEWCDQLYNANYGESKYKKWDGRRKPFEQLSLDGTHIATYNTRAECPFDTRAINRVLKGRQKTAYGYRWRYV